MSTSTSQPQGGIGGPQAPVLENNCHTDTDERQSIFSPIQGTLIKHKTDSKVGSQRVDCQELNDDSVQIAQQHQQPQAQLCSIGQNSEEQANSVGKPLHQSDESQQFTRSAAEQPNLVQQCTEPSQGKSNQESQQSSAVSQYFNQAEELLMEDDAPDLMADMIISRENVALQPQPQPEPSSNDDKNKSLQPVGKIAAAPTQLQAPLEMIQELHERSRISGDASVEVEEPTPIRAPLQGDSVEFTVGTQSIPKHIKLQRQQAQSNREIDAEKKACHPSEISSRTPIELGTYDLSKFESTEQSVLKENPVTTQRSQRKESQRVSKMLLQEMDQIADQINEKQRLDNLFRHSNSSPIYEHDEVPLDKNFESMQFSVRSSELNYPGLTSTGPKIRTADQKRSRSRSRRSKNADITEILASSDYGGAREKTMRSSKDSVLSIDELRQVKAQKPRVPEPLFKFSQSQSQRLPPSTTMSRMGKKRLGFQLIHRRITDQTLQQRKTPGVNKSGLSKCMSFTEADESQEASRLQTQEDLVETIEPPRNSKVIDVRASNSLTDPWRLNRFEFTQPEASTHLSDQSSPRHKMAHRYNNSNACLTSESRANLGVKQRKQKNQSGALVESQPLNNRGRALKSRGSQRVQTRDRDGQAINFENLAMKKRIQQSQAPLYNIMGLSLRQKDNHKSKASTSVMTPGGADIMSSGYVMAKGAISTVSIVELANNQAGAVSYSGLDRSAIAQMPLESLYKRIEINMQKTKSFFDIRLSEALKQNEGDLKSGSKTAEESLPTSIPFELIKARFLKQQQGAKSAGRRRIKDPAPQKVREGSVLQQISAEFDAYTRQKQRDLKKASTNRYLEQSKVATPWQPEEDFFDQTVQIYKQSKPPASAYGVRHSSQNTQELAANVFQNRGMSFNGQTAKIQQTNGSISQSLFWSLRQKVQSGSSQGGKPANRYLTTASGSRNNIITSDSERFSSTQIESYAKSTQNLTSSKCVGETRASDNGTSGYPQRGQKIQDLLNRVRMQHQDNPAEQQRMLIQQSFN